MINRPDGWTEWEYKRAIAGGSPALAKSDDLVIYIVKKVGEYIDTPREVRKQRRAEVRPKEREAWSRRWFGMIPISMKLWMDGKRKK